MMKAIDILKELEPLGKESYKRTLMNHGIREPFYGVKIEDMKKIVKRVGKSYPLALELYDTGVFDAMYLAGLLVEDRKMTRDDLGRWADRAYCPMLSEYTVPWVASESGHGWELGLEWIESDQERIAAAGWSTLSALASIRKDDELDLKKYEQLLGRVVKDIHKAPNRVRYVMNAYVIAVGGYLKSLTGKALDTAGKLGKVEVDMGGTACKLPAAADYIQKIEARGSIGKKRKSAKC